MSKELIVLSPDEIFDSGYNEKNLFEQIEGQVEKLNELSNVIEKATKAAENAKESAEKAKSKSAGFGKKKTAIEELQSAGIALAEAVQEEAEAQKVSFEFQRKLAEISKYLFGLGVSNIASNRFVARELEMRLKGASQGKLSELAQQELMNVLKQLKEQEDILLQLQNIFKVLKSHDESLQDQLCKSQQIDEKVQEQEEVNRLHDKQIINLSECGKRYEEKLQVQMEAVKRYYEQLSALCLKNNDLAEQVKSNLKIIEAQETKINLLEEEVADLKVTLDSKAASKKSNIILAFAILAFVISVINFFV